MTKPSAALIEEVSAAIGRAFLSAGQDVGIAYIEDGDEMSRFLVTPVGSGSPGRPTDGAEMQRRLSIVGVPIATMAPDPADRNSGRRVIFVDWRLAGPPGFEPETGRGLEIMHTPPAGFEVMKRDPETALRRDLVHSLDVTGIVLSLSLPSIHRISEVGPLISALAAVPYGHYAAKVTEANVAEFFGVSTADEVSFSMLNAARRHAGLVPPRVLTPTLVEGALPISEILVFKTMNILSKLAGGAPVKTPGTNMDALRKEWGDLARGLIATSERFGAPAPAAEINPSPSL